MIGLICSPATAFSCHLRQDGFAVDWVRDGQAAEAAAANGVYDLLVLDLGLITKADHRMSTVIAAVSLVILGVGWLYMESNWPVRIPQQVLRFTPAPLPDSPKFAQARGLRATYDPRADRVVFESEVTNKGDQPMKVLAFTTSTLTFNQGQGLVAEPATVEPGKTVTVKGTIQDKAWSQERLIPLDKPQMGIAGLLVFESDGKQSTATIEAPVRPTSFVNK